MLGIGSLTPVCGFKNRPLQGNAPEAHKSGSLILRRRTSVIIRAGTLMLVVCGKHIDGWDVGRWEEMGSSLLLTHDGRNVI